MKDFITRFMQILFTEDGGAGGGEGDPKPGEGEGDPKTYSEEVFKGVVKQRDEFKGKVTDLTTKVDELTAQLKKISDDDLKNKGDLQTLLDNAKAELETTKNKLTDTETKLNEKTTELEAIETDTKKELLTKLTKEQKEFIKDKPVAEIREFVKLVAGSNSADPDNGGNLNPKGDIKLTDEQKKQAKDMDLSEELFIEYLKDREKRKPKESKKV